MALNIIIGYYILSLVLETSWLAFSGDERLEVTRVGMFVGMVIQVLILMFLFGLN